MVQETAIDNDNISYIIDPADGQEKSADKIYAGIQLCSKLESNFLKIDTNSERSLKFQNEL